jgi:hypothetical protein
MLKLICISPLLIIFSYNVPTCCSGRPEYAKETSWLRHGGRPRAADFLGKRCGTFTEIYEHIWKIWKIYMKYGNKSMNMYGKYGDI